MPSAIKQYLTRIVYPIFIVLIISGSANAFIIESHIMNPDGTYTYTYLIDNTPMEGIAAFDIMSWSLEFPIIPDWNQNDASSVPAGGVIVPNSGWTALSGTPITGQSAQDFVSLSASFEVETGQQLGGFSFTSSFAPGSIAFYEFGVDAQTNSGVTIGPIPEPETWQLFATAQCFYLFTNGNTRSPSPIQLKSHLALTSNDCPFLHQQSILAKLRQIPEIVVRYVD